MVAVAVLVTDDVLDGVLEGLAQVAAVQQMLPYKLPTVQVYDAQHPPPGHISSASIRPAGGAQGSQYAHVASLSQRLVA